MTIVNHETGEITETLDKTSARQLTERIRLLAENIADQVEKMAGLIDEARTGSAWLALGYASWTAYVSQEFAGVLPRLDREPRREFVRELAARGMSTRAIAPVAGVGDSTVQRDLAGAPGGAPDENAEFTDLEIQAQRRKFFAAPAAPAAPAPSVVGMDGKNYTPRPRATERDLSEFIGSDRSIQDGRYVQELMKELGAVASLHQFDASRIAAVADDTTLAAIDAAFDNFSTWRDQVKAKRNGLRVIKGGMQ